VASSRVQSATGGISAVKGFLNQGSFSHRLGDMVKYRLWLSFMLFSLLLEKDAVDRSAKCQCFPALVEIKGFVLGTIENTPFSKIDIKTIATHGLASTAATMDGMKCTGTQHAEL
jgi:hypothetical protein